MHIIHHSPEKIGGAIIKILRKYPELQEYQVVFFGSRVSGRGSDRSDIDVGIIGPTKVPDAIWSKILEDVENLPYLYTIDVVDFGRVSASFRKHALSSSLPITP